MARASRVASRRAALRDDPIASRATRTRDTRTPRSFESSIDPQSAMASAFARCVPGGYDTNYTVAKALTHASLGCALLGCAGGYLGTGYLSSLAAMHVLMLISLETSSRALLKVRESVGRMGDSELCAF